MVLSLLFQLSIASLQIIPKLSALKQCLFNISSDSESTGLNWVVLLWLCLAESWMSGSCQSPKAWAQKSQNVTSATFWLVSHRPTRFMGRRNGLCLVIWGATRTQWWGRTVAAIFGNCNTQLSISLWNFKVLEEFQSWLLKVLVSSLVRSWENYKRGNFCSSSNKVIF